MEFTTQDATEIYATLKQMGNIDLPPKIQYAAARNRRLFEPIFESAQETLKTITERYCKVDETGKPVITNGEFEFNRKKDRDRFIEERKAMWDEVVTIDDKSLHLLPESRIEDYIERHEDKEEEIKLWWFDRTEWMFTLDTDKAA